MLVDSITVVRLGRDGRTAVVEELNNTPALLVPPLYAPPV